MTRSRMRRIRRASAKVRRRHRPGARRTHKVNTHHKFNQA